MGLLKDLKSKIWEDGCDVAENTLDAVLDSTLRYLRLDLFAEADLIRVNGDMDSKFTVGDGEIKHAILVRNCDTDDENLVNLNHLKDTGVVIFGIRNAEKRKDREKAEGNGHADHPNQMHIDDMTIEADDVPFADAESEIAEQTYEPVEDETPFEPTKKSKLAGKRKTKRR